MKEKTLLTLSLKEFLYYLLVSKEFYTFLENLDIEQQISISINILNQNHSSDIKMRLQNLQKWGDIGNNQLTKHSHFYKIIRQFKNYCMFIQQKYQQNKQYLIEDSKLTQDLALIILVYAEKLQRDCEEAYRQVKQEVNCYLSLAEQSVSITNIDLDRGIIYFDLLSDQNDNFLDINEIIKRYVNQFEIESVKPRSFYLPFTYKLSEKYNFIFMKSRKERELREMLRFNFGQSRNQNDGDIQDYQNEEINQYMSEDINDEDEDEENKTIILIRKRVQKVQNSTLKEQNQENTINSRKDLSLKQIALLIEQENCDRYRSFDETESEILEKIIYLIHEFELDQKIFNKYNIFIEIEENLINIFGDMCGEQKIEELVREIKENKDIIIKSVNKPRSQLQDKQSDIQELNKEYQNKKIKINLLDIELDVYSKIIYPILESEQEIDDHEESLKISYITFNGKTKDIFDQIFQEKKRLLKIEKNFTITQRELLRKFDIKFIQGEEGFKLECTDRRFKKFSKCFEDTTQSLMIKEDFEVQQILFKMLMNHDKKEINNLQQKYKFTIISEPLEGSNSYQFCLICQKSSMEKIKQIIMKKLNKLKENVTELNYELTEEDLEIFSQKADNFIQEALNQSQQDENTKQEEDELIQKNIKNGQIYLYYYLSDIIYEFKNNLIDFQRQRSNQIRKNFKMILSQNQIEKNIDEFNRQTEQMLEEQKKEINIQMISTEKFEDESNTLICGSVFQNLIILDHQFENHQQRLEEIFGKKNEFQVCIERELLSSISVNFNESENKFQDMNQFISILQQVRDQQVHLRVKERKFKKEITHENSVVFFGQNLVDSNMRIVNQTQLDQLRDNFFKELFLNAIQTGKKIHILVNDQNLRSILVQILLNNLENCEFKNIENNTTVKIYFIKSTQKDNQQDVLKKLSQDQNQNQDSQFLKAEEEIEKTLQIFKNHQKDQSDKLQSLKIENAQWYYEENKQYQNKSVQFDQTRCLIIDGFYRVFISKKNINQTDQQFLFIYSKQNNDEQIKQEEREVRFNFQNSEVLIKFLNLSLSFQYFFKLYPELYKIIMDMGNIINQQNYDDIILYATETSVKQKNINGLIFEEQVYRVVFDEDKYYIYPTQNPLFQNKFNAKDIQQEKIFINRQALISEQNSRFGNQQTKHQKINIKYDFDRQNASINQKNYELKLLVEKQDLDRAQNSLDLFFKYRKGTYEQAKKRQIEKIEQQNSLKFQYYTPKLKKLMIKEFKINQYKTIDYNDNECFYVITSESKTKIKNFEKNKISYLKIFKEENWLELLKQQDEKIKSMNINIEETKYFIDELSTIQTEYLYQLKDWEITNLKSYFFLIYSKKIKPFLSEYEVLTQDSDKQSKQEEFNNQFQLEFQIISKNTILHHYLTNKDQIKEYAFYNNFEQIKCQTSNRPDLQELNVLVFLRQKKLFQIKNIPLFYLVFLKK